MSKDRRLYPFSVIGYYEDNGQPFVEHVMAEDWTCGIIKAVELLEKKSGAFMSDARKHFREHVYIVEVIDGHHQGRTEHESICVAIDVPGLEVK
jgi:hypothetical protein